MGKIVSRIRRVRWAALWARVRVFVAERRRAARHLLFAGAAAFIVLLVHRQVYTLVTTDTRYEIPPVNTAMGPKWSGERGEQEFTVDRGEGTLFDPELVARVGHALEKSPWVREVKTVERVYPGRIRMVFEYRKPHVAVRGRLGYALIDSEGVRLPGVYPEPPKCARPVIITGVTSTPPPAGDRWDDPGVRQGLELADLLASKPVFAKAKIREIDVSNAGGRVDARRSEIAFVAESGCVLFWGRVRQKYGDPTLDEKIEHLREILDVYPDLDGLLYAKLYFSGTNAIREREATVKGPRR